MSASTATRRGQAPHEQNLVPFPNGSSRRRSQAQNDRISRSMMQDSANSASKVVPQLQKEHAESSKCSSNSKKRLSKSAVTTQRHSQGSNHQDVMNSAAGARRARKPPDWDAFYKNCMPEDVIVIDDTPEAEGSRVTTNGASSRAKFGESSKGIADKSSKAAVSNPINGVTGKTVYDMAMAIIHEKKKPGPWTAGPSDLSRTTRSKKRSLDHNPENHVPKLKRSLDDTGADDTEADDRRKRVRLEDSKYNSLTLWKYPEFDGLTERIVTVKGDISLRAGSIEPWSGPRLVDDADGHLVVVKHTYLTSRYLILRTLGQGTFGQVVAAYDKKRNAHVAIKIIRAVQKYRDAAKIELRVLETLRRNDQSNKYKCIHLKKGFNYRGHTCIATELLDMSLFDFMKMNSFAPFPISHIQTFAKQLLTSIAWIHELGLIHTDLKPENILLKNAQYKTFPFHGKGTKSRDTPAKWPSQRKVLLEPDIRLIDFGSATFENEYHSSVVSTRHYRAPEVIFGSGWSFPCDIWSVACILVEFWTGEALFQTHDNLEHLAMMERVLNAKFHRDMASPSIESKTRGSGRSSSASSYFKSNTQLDWPKPETSRSSIKFVKSMKLLDDIIPDAVEPTRLLQDLLYGMFELNPNVRISAKEALEHKFFDHVIVDEGVDSAKSAIGLR